MAAVEINVWRNVGNALKMAAQKNPQRAIKRFVSYRKNCAFWDKPRCDPCELQKSECFQEIKEGRILPDHPLQSLWNKPECCDDPCKDAYVRFDDLYYFISDKATRKYTRTWNECPKYVRTCKRVCCFDGKERAPPLPKRPKNAIIDTACPADPNCMALTGGCPKINMPYCRAVRATLKCRPRKREPCPRFCTPYPSFSECLRDQPEPRHPIECPCLTIPMRCELIGLDAPPKLPRC